MTDRELRATLKKLRSLATENEIVEFKEAKNAYDFSKLGRYFSALSNEANLKNRLYAWLIFGIEDKNHKIVGTQFRPERRDLESLKTEIANKTTNRLTFIEIYELFESEGRVIMFQIPAASKGIPTAFEGLFYGREGESLAGLNIQEIDTIRMQIQHHDWSADIIEDVDISTLDPEAIALARELYISKHSDKYEEIKEWSDIDFLNKAKITRRGKITNTAIILLGKEESEELLSPAIAKIRWVLKGADGIERDYYIASCPFIKSVRTIYNKIRNLKYRYINPEHMTLFPEEIDTYEPYVIREALNNAVAHQDYSLGGRINVIENEDRLVFTNKGSFIPGNIDNVLCNDAPEEIYRNNFLVQAMVGIKMVDTIGSGIRKMFNYQRKRLFPLPDYEFDNARVSVTIMGKIIDMNYANILARNLTLRIEDVWLLNKVQLKKDLSDEEVAYLRKKKLVEGRKPNLFLAIDIAKKIDKKAEYTKNKALDKQYYLDFIIKHIQIHQSSTRKEIDGLLWKKLPDWMDEKQKKNKIRNLLLELRTKGLIINRGTVKESKWVLSKQE